MKVSTFLVCFQQKLKWLKREKRVEKHKQTIIMSVFSPQVYYYHFRGHRDQLAALLDSYRS